MRKLVENARKVKYLGEGLVGVYKNGRLVERYELEKGDDLLEAFGTKKLQEAIKLPYEYGSNKGYVTLEFTDRDNMETEIEYGEDGITVAVIEQPRYSQPILAFTDDINKGLMIQKELAGMSFNTLQDLYDLFPTKIKGVDVDIYSE